jgi:C1A family cysteine protease/PKD repeat protein
MKIMKIINLLIISCLCILITQSSVLPVYQEKMMESNKFSSIRSVLNESLQTDSTELLPCKTMQTTLKSFNPNQLKPHKADDLPSSFSWTENDGDWTSPVKNQGNCGSCWDFAAIGLIESLINIEENHPGLDPDLSEQYVLSCLSGAGSCNGGLSQKALELIISTKEKGNFYNGVPLESCMPYQADDTFPCENKCHDWIDYLVPLTDYGSWDSYGFEEDRERIKTMIMEKGPVISDIYASEDFRSWGRRNHKKTDIYPYEKPIIWSNHVVIIVGWKDDLQLTNGGYWICKNSWGKSWGNNGFFNIEYNGQGIDNGYIIWADYNPYSYDWNPVSRPGGPYTADMNERITFNGSKSFDVEDAELEYEWDFGNNITKTGSKVTYHFPNRGIYTVSLTVMDTQGNKDTKKTAVFIEPWKTKDSWTYRCNRLDLHVNHDDIELLLHLTIPQMSIEISDENSTSYQVRFYGEIHDETMLLISNYSKDQELVFSKSIISGVLTISKKRFFITDIQLDVHGRLGFKNFFPSLFNFPFSAEFSIDSKEKLQLLQFPLFTGKTYDIPLTSFDVNGTISSPLFDLVYLINTIADLFGKSFLPEPINQLLPNIDIKEALDTTFGSNRLTMACLPGLTVKNETKTVEAGTFPAYAITIPSLGEFSYSHSVENIIQMTLNLSKLNTPKGFIDLSMDLELVETTYQSKHE